MAENRWQYNLETPMEIIAGVDEAGRGPLAGPVVAAAVILPDDHGIKGLRDSKKLSPKKREDLFNQIKDRADAIGIGQSSVGLIDKINIRNATFKAMQMALGRLRIKPDRALIDGDPLPNQIVPNEGIIGGDDKQDPIKAASIVAKVTRDNLMLAYAKIFPEYGLDQHKGYGTALHFKNLIEYKATPIHRKSFRPVKNNLPTFKWLSRTNRVGWLGEKLAALYLQDQGVKIEKMNQHCSPYGEIDIIGKKEDIWIFTEVKSTLKFTAEPEQKLEHSKLGRIEKTVNSYLQEHDWIHNFRIDGIAVYLGKKEPIIKHYKGIQFD